MTSHAAFVSFLMIVLPVPLHVRECVLMRSILSHLPGWTSRVTTLSAQQLLDHHHHHHHHHHHRHRRCSFTEARHYN